MLSSAPAPTAPRSRSPSPAAARRDAYRSDSAAGSAHSLPHDRSGDRNDEGEHNPGTQLYIRGLSFRTTDQELREVFEKYGDLDEVSVVKDPHLNECRGFAFVRFRNKDDATRAIEGEHDKDFHGRRLIVELSRRARPRPKTPGEYLGRLSAREVEMRSRLDSERRGGSRGRDDRDRDDRRRYDDRDTRRYDDRDARRYDDRDSRRYDDRGYDDRRRYDDRDRRY